MCLIEILVAVEILLEYHRVVALYGIFVGMLLFLPVSIIQIEPEHSCHNQGKYETHH